ncbi:hypothetical protein [Streptomyces cyaneofuscatus]|uniref:hypothetical protein n=1 Tax=Streptomyces cyaneofuscatus TaxID=66883 RepID=UPI002E0E4C96|nr:hypothetical protein OG366_30450 [Streptomyces cyaneofuscatus]WTF34437.1 hypothetical protein OG973_06030 [Streptomyces cyaneofuscatus]
MTHDEPWPVLVRATGDASPLYEPKTPGALDDPEAFTLTVPLDDDRLELPEELSDALRSWSSARPPEGYTSRPELRAHAQRGLEAARRLARHLGPSWVVRYEDEAHRTAKWVCWGCDRLHWERDEHGTPPHPLDITVEGEYQHGPLRADGFGDFLPDDPAAALPLSDGLVAALHAWAASIDATLNQELAEREDGAYDAAWQRLFSEGAELAERTARELGPVRTVTYKGLAHGGLSVLTSVTWRGDRKL